MVKGLFLWRGMVYGIGRNADKEAFVMFATQQDTPIGPVTLQSDGERLTGLWMAGQKYFGGRGGVTLEEAPDLALFGVVRKWLAAYFAGERPALSDIPLAPAGSAFRQAVWAQLCAIPYGEVMTYGAIGEKVARALHKERIPGQAVGGAVGHNPVSILIPCHRVVGANGSLTGYAGGLERKRFLLSHEGVDMTGLFSPTKGTAL